MTCRHGTSDITPLPVDRFVGPLIWITIGGSIDVLHPDGRRVRTGPVYGKLYESARMLGKDALVEVEMPAKPWAEPRVLSIARSKGREQ